MTKIIFSSVVVLGLSACASMGGSSPRILSANEAGITYQVKSTKVASTESAAQEYCNSRNRNATLDRVTPVGKDSNVSYFCR